MVSHQMGFYVGVIVGGFGGYVATIRPWLALGLRVCGIVGIAYANFLVPSEQLSRTTDTRDQRRSGGGRAPGLPATFVRPARGVASAARAGGGSCGIAGDSEQSSGIGQGLAGVSATLYGNRGHRRLWPASTADRWMRRTSRGRVFTSA